MNTADLFSNAHVNEELAKRVMLSMPVRLRPQTITVREVKVEADPPATVYNIEIQAEGGGVWMETLNTPELLRTFLKGIQMATCMAGDTLLANHIWKFGPESCIQHFP